MALDASSIGKQLADMQLHLESQRQLHAAESRAQEERIRTLERSLMDARQHIPVREARTTETTTTTTTTTTLKKERSPSLGVPRTPGGGSPKRATVSTATAANGGLVSSVRKPGATRATIDLPPAGLSEQPAKTMGSAIGRFSAKQRQLENTNPPPAKGAADSGNKQALLVRSASFNSTTALQHAWDKLCVRARGEFTVKELAFLSLKTLHDLMHHYNFRDPILVAQVEAQWALYQEGHRNVANPTPFVGAARPCTDGDNRLRPAEEFDLTGNVALRPHLSRRSLLRDGPSRTANPNDSTALSRVPSPSGRGARYYDPHVTSNPNEPAERSRSADPLRGKRIVPGPPENVAALRRAGKGPGALSPCRQPPASVVAYPVQAVADRHEGVRVFAEASASQPKLRGVRTGYPLPTERGTAKSIQVWPHKPSQIF